MQHSINFPHTISDMLMQAICNDMRYNGLTDEIPKTLASAMIVMNGDYSEKSHLNLNYLRLSEINVDDSDSH